MTLVRGTLLCSVLAGCDAHRSVQDSDIWPEPSKPRPAIAPFDAEAARIHQDEWAEALGLPVEMKNSIGMTFRLIPPGEFVMGSPSSEEGREKVIGTRGRDESPQHRVRISRAFYLGAHEVTVAQFRLFAEDAAYRTEAEQSRRMGFRFDPHTGKIAHSAGDTWRTVPFDQADDHPVVYVSWNDAMSFCRWLTERSGEDYRLPTEAEWEYACRAGTTTRFHHGDDAEDLAAVANVADAALRDRFPVTASTTIASRDGFVFTSPVGSFKANAWGLYDMEGNVLEWCADWFGADYYAKSPLKDPPGPASGSSRVYRGGSWLNGPPVCSRSAWRAGTLPQNASNHLGFRVAMTPAQSKGGAGRGDGGL